MQRLGSHNGFGQLTEDDAIILGSSSYTTDATSGIAIPQNASEWSAFIASKGLSTWSNPNLLYALQDTVSPLVPSIGSATLTVSGTVTYQQVITGFATKGIKLAQTASNYASSTDASLPTPSTTSALLLALIDAQALGPGVGQFPNLMGMVAANAFSAEMYQNSLNWYVHNGANNQISVNALTGRGVVPVVIKHDVTNLAIGGYTDKDSLAPTYAALAATKLLFLGNNTAYTATGGFGCVYFAVWWGAAAERTAADVRSLLTAMGYSPTW